MADREWIYMDASWSQRGVTLKSDHLEWWENSGSSQGGGWCSQSFDEFLRNGVNDTATPADVAAELTAAVHAMIARNKA